MTEIEAGGQSRVYRGVPVAEGIGIGPARLMDPAHVPSHVPRYRIGDDSIEREVRRLKRAFREAREELEELAERVRRQLGEHEADMIRAQVLMVEDPAFVTEVEELIVEKRLNPEAAVAEVVGRFEEMIASIDDPYLRERSADVRDAGRRVLGKLLFVDGAINPTLTEPAVIVASHLVPSLTVRLDREMVLGFVSEHGGRTSHAAILARSLAVPAVTGLEGLTDEVLDEEMVIVDGADGVVIVQPTNEQLEKYREMERRFLARRRAVIAQTARPAVTADGAAVKVLANVGDAGELALAREYEADGVGLYRTEVEYLTHTSLPHEERLVEEYSRAVELFPQAGVVFRALDIGGDKFPPSVPLAHEKNPFIGLRGLRLLLQHVDDLMLPQLRAIARASAAGRTAVMYPMIASVADLQAALELFDRALDEVKEEGHAVGPDIRQGVMIEVPSCVPMLPELLGACSFGSVGTNDLVQYLLAADRNSERMVDAYDPFHPAVIRTLAAILEAGRAAERDLSVCGEAASDPPFLALLIGLGYRVVSVNVGAIPRVKGVVRALSVAGCEDLARRALSARTAEEVLSAAEDFTVEHVEPAQERALDAPRGKG